jgi:hypothetical protein
MRSTKHAWVLGSVLALAASCGDNARIGLVVETRVAKQTVAAGDQIDARCSVLTTLGEPAVDENGEELTTKVEFTVAYQHEDSFSTDTGGKVIAIRAGTATVRCSAPSLGLVDDEPEQIEIVPGPASRVITDVASATVTAGAAVGVDCVAFDAFNNAVTGFERSLALSPFGAGTEATTETVTATLVGEYEVSCVVQGAAEVQADFFVVVPALPSSLTVAADPERSVYAIDDQVTLVAEARDRFGNRVDDITVAYETSPALPSPSEARFRFPADGTYTLTATVTSPTFESAVLTASETVFVNSAGPAIQCMRVDAPALPSDAYMLQRAPSTLIVPVRVTATFQVQSVTIGGQPATLNPTTGNYQAGVAAGFGMTFVDVVARDQFGRENSTTCFLLVAETFQPETSTMGGAIGFRLNPNAISDPAAGGLNSINDILGAVLTSDRLRQLVDQGLFAANPINDGSCGFTFSLPEVNYNQGTIQWNQPSSSVSLVPGGLETRITLPNVRLRVNACGTITCIGGSNVLVTASSITATIRFNLGLQGGVLRASLAAAPVVTVGAVDLDGDGFCGFVIDLLEFFFENTVRDIIRDALSGFINTDVAPLLDQLVSSLDINTLGASFSVPRLDGSGNVGLQFGLAFSTFDITTARLLLGIGTRFTPATVAHNRASLGVPRRAANPLLDPPGTNTTRTVGLSLYEGVFNQVLHGLWRGGFFQAGLQIGPASATIDARLPPVVAIAGSQAQLMLGGIQASILIPGIIEPAIPILFGGRANASVTLSGDSLRFGNLTLTQLFVSFQASLTQNQRNAMANFLTQILQSVLVDAINNGLPAFPIPTFALPPAAGEFGLPAGAELGIINPILSTSGSHFVLTGSFGRRN